jgi:ATP-dependent DNA ligase
LDPGSASGRDRTHKYPQIAAAVAALPARQAYLDGELCGVRSDGITSFSMIRRRQTLLAPANSPLHYSDHQIGVGLAFYEKACPLGVEGIVSRRADAPHAPGNRGVWLKCLNRQEFVVIGWTDPEGARPFLGALLTTCSADSFTGTDFGPIFAPSMATMGQKSSLSQLSQSAS